VNVRKGRARAAQGGKGSARGARRGLSTSNLFQHPIPQARGVADDATRASLVHAWERVATSPEPALVSDPPHTGAGGLPPSPSSPPSAPPPLPLGAGALAARVLALHALLGARPDIDTPTMAARTPALVTDVSPAQAAGRVVAMKAAGVPNADVAALIAARPGLLLQPPPASPEAPEARLAAWRAGLAGDGDAEWEARRRGLAAYVATHGDAAVGARGGDAGSGTPPGILTRWAAHQRARVAGGALSGARRAALEALGFEFDGEAAEWGVWAAAAAAQAAAEGAGPGRGALPGALAGGLGRGGSRAGDGLALENWKSVQRVARRAGVLGAARVASLDAWGFDWGGADALS